ncbi:DNA-binding protein [Lutibaculum baratangense]|uniref:KfrA N-terminal DNA-binding domain-containing protein n=1 Tax=Lutibaculum baratangense AMV1 TaxID=631454 RepID=V4T7A7_9HYPH|nr:DNA-binding protein [Lutibaculum baratangense]ESR22503.1 hypothetical protein N177_4068 [Lutibaculum baratangense AMV1]
MVTEEDIHRARDQLDAQGIRPTYEKVRELLGRVSYSQLTGGMKTWRPKNWSTEDIPKDITEEHLRSLTSIWAMAQKSLKAAHALEMAELREELATKDAAIKDYEEDRQALEATIAQLEVAAQELRDTVAGLQSVNDELRGEVKGLRARPGRKPGRPAGSGAAKAEGRDPSDAAQSVR